MTRKHLLSEDVLTSYFHTQQIEKTSEQIKSLFKFFGYKEPQFTQKSEEIMYGNNSSGIKKPGQ